MTAQLENPAAVALGGDETARRGEIAYWAELPPITDAVPVARALVRAIAEEYGCAAEAELLASELATCALRRVASGGEALTLTVVRSGAWLWIAVGACGTGWWPVDDAANEASYACGLAIVARLADRFGHFGTSGGVAGLWAEVALASDAEGGQ